MSSSQRHAIECPACNAPVDSRPAHTFSAQAAAQHFVLIEEYRERHEQLVQHIKGLWGADSCDVLACSACGLRFAWPFVAGDGLFYNLAYPFSAYPQQRWEFLQTVQALPAALGSEGQVLEIGSGFGHFLRQIAPVSMPAERVIAIEYNDVARQRLVEQGYQAHGVDVRDPRFDRFKGNLAAVFMFQVLEHMDDIAGLMQRLNGLLRPGASVFIAVPNPDRIAFNEAHGGLFDMPPNHISQWPKAAFEALAARAGWALVEHRTEPLAWHKLVKQDLVSSHMQRAQRSGSLANRMRARPRNRLRVAIEGALALAAAPSRLPAWAAAAQSHSRLGDSVWVHFRAR